MIRSFEAATLAKNFEVLLWNREYGPGRIEMAVRKLLENRVKGVAVLTSVIELAEVEELAAHEIAVVPLDRGEPGRYIGCIRVDFLRGMSEAIDHLRQLGHRRFTFVSGPESIPSAVAVRSAVFEALHARCAL
jgi:LacI family transcriptional regulator